MTIGDACPTINVTHLFEQMAEMEHERWHAERFSDDDKTWTMMQSSVLARKYPSP